MPFEESNEYRDQWDDACKLCFCRGGFHGTWLGRPCPNATGFVFKEKPICRSPIAIDLEQREVSELERLFRLDP